MPGVLKHECGAKLSPGDGRGSAPSNFDVYQWHGNEAGQLYELDGVWNMNTGNMTQTTITAEP